MNKELIKILAGRRVHGWEHEGPRHLQVQPIINRHIGANDPRHGEGQLFDRRVIKKFLEITAVISGTLSFVVIFVDVPTEWKLKAGLAFLVILALTYLVIWLWSNNLNSIDINVEGSDVAIKTGDIFQQPGLKAIAFNEYFDTQVDNKIIGETSLNGVFIQKHLGVPLSELDRHIEEYAFDISEVLDENEARKQGRRKDIR